MKFILYFSPANEIHTEPITPFIGIILFVNQIFLSFEYFWYLNF